MKLLGITGGVGMGKSTAAALLEKQGVAVIDTDQISRQLVEPGQPALQEITSVFGDQILTAAGELDRKQLAGRIFANPTERGQLEAILHPKIQRIWRSQADEWRAHGVGLGAVVIPLLYETRAESAFDAVICIACSPASQRERLSQRGWDAGEIRRRIEAQWPVTEKVNRANFLVWTDTSLDAHAVQWEKVRHVMSHL